MKTVVQGHGIRPLRSTRVPQSTIVVAVRATLSGDRAGYEERWRCAHAIYRRTGGKKAARQASIPTDSPARLWDNVTRWCGYQGLTFMWVCDLSWTARISAAFIALPARGWHLDAFSLNPGASWMVWKKGKATLKVADVLSVWPVGIDRIAAFFGHSRLDVPVTETRQLRWIKAARVDCEILDTAVTAYVSWVASEDLGRLAVTGNSQAWTAFRRRFMDVGILAHSDKEVRAAERRAMWTGRCEAYWHGSLGFQVVHEWDLVSAYTNIAATTALPVFLHRPLDPGEDWRQYLDNPQWTILAEVDIETEVPTVPTGHDHAIVWPIGAFPSTLWEPEIRLALDYGASVRVRRAWVYRRAYALRTWATWILGQLDGEESDLPAWRRHILKRWGNVLVGRFGMQYPQWKAIAYNAHPDVRYTSVQDVETGDEYAVMQVGHKVWQQKGMVDANDSAPQITGYVMSVARAHLFRLCDAAPPRSVLYVDTDSLLVTDFWLDAMVALQQSPLGEGLRLKRSWRGMSIYGPRQLVTGEEVRIAGLPKSARRVARHDFEGEVTESLLSAMGGRRLDAVHMVARQWRVEGVDPRRDGPAVGWTVPFALGDRGS